MATTLVLKLRSSDLPYRRPVWAALSEIFLDTSFGEADYERLARVLGQSPYTAEELNVILVTEVRPVCIWNFFWWEWAGFDSSWLEARILSHRASPFRLLYMSGLLTLLYPWAPEWRRLLQAVHRYRTPESQQAPPPDTASPP